MMKIKFSILILWILTCFLPGFAGAQITFQKEIAGAGATAICQADDEGYIISGGKLNVWFLMKTDKNGDVIWGKVITSAQSSGKSVEKTQDGGYVIAGFIFPLGGYPDVFLIKTNSVGDTLWTKAYGGLDEDIGYAIQQTNDSGYIVVGHTRSFGLGPRSAYVIRTDANGDTLWTKTYGGAGWDRAYAVQQTTDGGFIIAGATSSYGNGGLEDAYLIKIDANGNLLWSKTYGGSGAERFFSVKQTPDGGYIAVGETFSYVIGYCYAEQCPEVYLIKTDSTGNIIWQKTYGSPNDKVYDRGSSVELTYDGGYIIEGRTGLQPISGGAVLYDVLLIKTDANGDTLWTKTYGGPEVEDWFDNNFFQQTSDTGYILVATKTIDPGNGIFSIYIIKTDSNGVSGCNEGHPILNIGTPGTFVSSGSTVAIPPTVVTNPAPTIVNASIIDTVLCYNCFVVLVSKTDVTCNGGSNGSIDITLPAGTPPFTYLWSTGDTTEDLTGLTAGTYQVTIIDSTGCNPKEAITITQPPPLGSSFASTNVSCSGGSNGAINLTPSGGTPPYTYLWSTGSIMQNISGLTAGSYSVTVTDNNGCQRTDNIIITQPQPNVVTGTTTPSTDCDSTGTINITASGGTPPYTYSWSNGTSTEDLDSVSAGQYYVIVADSKNCFGIASFTVNEIPAFTLMISTTGATCGNADGTASVTVSGGATPYTYSWSTGDTGSSAANLTAGAYSVSVIDSTGCTETAIATISNIAGPAITGISVMNVACFGQCNGQATVSAAGGILPYTYLWNDSSGQNTPVATGLCDGVYTVFVTDSNGCMAVSSVTINEPFPLSANVIAFSDVKCAGSNNGTATVLATGGTTPYLYLWSNGSTTSSATGLPADTSFVLVTDDNGCTDMDSVVLSEPAALTAAVAVNDVSCSGGNDGSATATATGGIPPYSYLWSNGQITSTASGFTAGTYAVSVSDSNGCEKTTAFTIEQPAALNISVTSTGVSCNGGNNGSASLITTGGTPPYNYLWSTNDTTASVTGLTSQTYFVNVTDSNGCNQTNFVAINEPSALLLAINSFPDTGNSGMGMAWVNVSGGTIPYTYQWNDPAGQTADTAKWLFTRNYSVTVSDGNGCMDSASGTVGNYTNINQYVLDNYKLSIYPNPTSGIVTLQFSTPHDEDVIITVYNILGKRVYEKIVSTGNISESHKIDISGLPGGMYLLQLESEGIAVRKRVIKL